MLGVNRQLGGVLWGGKAPHMGSYLPIDIMCAPHYTVWHGIGGDPLKGVGW